MRSLFATLPALLLAGSLAAQKPQPEHSPAVHAAVARSADERQLFALEDGWATALVRRDTAYFRHTLAPGYVYSDEHGVENKDQVLRDMTSPDDTVEYAGNEDMHAHIYGATGIVTGILVSRGHGKSGAFQHRYRFTDTWIKRGGRWVMVASQDYDIPSGN